jgi:uncharacterized membrane protein HdeD (DUF308 family)
VSPFTAPTAEELARFRRSYSRHRRIVWGIALGAMPVWIATIVFFGDSDWILGLFLGLWVIVSGVLSVALWRCPRCALLFGRQWRVRRCPECGLELEPTKDAVGR